MTPTIVLPLIIGGLYAAGVYLLLDRSLTRVLLGFLLLGNATNVLVLSAGGDAGSAPILGYSEPEDMNDPLPQALILTAIVITFGVSALLLSLVYRVYTSHLSLDLDDLAAAEEREEAAMEREVGVVPVPRTRDRELVAAGDRGREAD